MDKTLILEHKSSYHLGIGAGLVLDLDCNGYNNLRQAFFGSIDPIYNHNQPCFIFKVYYSGDMIGISYYSIYLEFNIPSGGIGLYCNDYIFNIPYMPKSVLEKIQQFQVRDSDIGKWIENKNLPKEYGVNEFKHTNNICMGVVLTRIKKQIVDKLNEDSTFQQLSKLNIVQEIQDLRAENKKLQKEREYQCSELSSMQRSIHRMQEDMKQLLATTSKIQEENTQLTKLLQEKEKTKQLSTTLQESQGLSFTHANTIGQALMGESDVYNCM
jgi:hypothetical protein